MRLIKQLENGLDVRKRQGKCCQNDELFFLGFKKVKKMQASVINPLQKNQVNKVFEIC